MPDKADVIEQVCNALLRNDPATASQLASQYPFVPGAKPSRKCSEYQMTQIFIRDGFIDRYSGSRLVFPGMVRLLSRLMPAEFPAHTNWKMAESHIVYWELFPTIDHEHPVARGGVDNETNWVTTSIFPADPSYALAVHLPRVATQLPCRALSVCGTANWRAFVVSPMVMPAAHTSVYTTPPVKRRDLENGLTRLGWHFLRSGVRHDVWTDGEREEAVPRHREINERLARAILRRARKGQK